MHWPVDPFVSPPVVPGPRRQVDVAVLTAGGIDRCCHQLWPQQYLIVEGVGGRIVREVIEQRSQHGNPASRRLPEERIKVGEQTVAQLQELTANGLDARAEAPGLVALSADL